MGMKGWTVIGEIEQTTRAEGGGRDSAGADEEDADIKSRRGRMALRFFRTASSHRAAGEDG